ncbi:MAG: AMP-binding protein, partial [Ilumatobacteraceae bacterium]
MRWGDTVAYWARWQGSACMVRFGDRDLTWAALDARASSLAASLADLGVGHGDRVGLLMSNRPEFLEVMVACARLGAICAPFNRRFTAPELAFVVTDADCAVVVTESALVGG